MAATMTKDTTNHVWNFVDTIDDSSYNVVFDTQDKFLDAKIKAQLSITSGAITPSFDSANSGLLTYFTDDGTAASNSIRIIPQATNTKGFIEAHDSSSPVNGTTAYYNIITATPVFDGGGITISVDQVATNTGTNLVATAPDTYSNGVTIQPQYLANRAAVQYNGAVDGWVSVANDTNALNATNNTTYSNGTKFYLTQVTVPKNKKFTLITSVDTDWDTISDITLTNNKCRKVFATNAGAIYARQTTSGFGIVYVRSYGESTDIKVVESGTLITTSVTQNDTTVTTTGTDGLPTAVSRGTASWGTGWITNNSIAAATFAAAATADTTYIDISNTTEAPVLSSGDYLYINKGYVDNLKISLAKLVPDTITGKTMAPANYILTGYAAFDGSGTAINGTMSIYGGAYTVNVS